MPDPQHPAEEALRRYAEKRRAAAPDSPPPGLRTVVLKEAQARYRPGASSAQGYLEEGRKGFWFRFIILGPVFGVLLAGFFLVNHWRQESSQPLAESSPAPTPGAFDNTLKLESAGEKLARSAPEPLPRTPPPLVASAPVEVMKRAPADSASELQELPAVAGALREESETIAFKRDAVLNDKDSTPVEGRFANGAMTANFVQTQVETGGVKDVGSSLEQARVLTRFLMRQDGAEVVIKDEDGSEYRGHLAAADPAGLGMDSSATLSSGVAEIKRGTAGSGAGFRARTATDARRQKDLSEGIDFHVEGLNKTLNQQIVVRGQVMPAIEAPSAQAGTAPSTQGVQAQQMRFNAQVRIAGAPEVEVEAVQEFP